MGKGIRFVANALSRQLIDMIIILIIVVLACFLFLFRRKRRSTIQTKSPYYVAAQAFNFRDTSRTKTLQDDKHATTVIKKRMIPRKTYLSGFLRGKYWGEMAVLDGANYEHEVFYNFHIYEADVYSSTSNTCTCITPLKQECSGLHTETEGEFVNKVDSIFPKERLPRLLPVIIKKEGKEYAVNVHEPQLANARFISQLHQTEGKEVFGTIEANITGFLLDFTVEEYTETYPDNNHSPDNIIAVDAAPQIRRDRIHGGAYYQPFRRHKRFRTYNSFVPNEGCVSSAIGIIAIIVWATFLIAILPQAAIILPFIAVPLLFRLIPPVVWKWSVTFVGGIICLGILASIFSPTKYPKSVVRDNLVADTANRTKVNDSMITHYLRWKNYDGQYFQGSIILRRSAIASATEFKTSLQVHDNTMRSYDELVYRLKEHDKDHLSGVYHLFDSIRSAQHLPADKFAELIVSFVQEIPYAVVLPEACDASLYADQFIRKYLATPNAKCDGYQKFGINTPVEFMANLNGDCDTRTLLIYTMLSHYKYDVALLSSEYYNHSLIGINLPYNGVSFISDSKQYVLWETTAADIRPGVVPYEISNLNYWRISLKSE
jgi:hypothetical protein